MRVYLASRFSRREEMVRYAEELKARGHEVDARWLTDPHHRVSGRHEDAEFNAGLAEHDYEDISKCDVLILFNDKDGGRGGRYVELGLALAWGKRVMLVGERTNVFTFLGRVEYAGTFGVALMLLDGWHDA